MGPSRRSKMCPRVATVIKLALKDLKPLEDSFSHAKDKARLFLHVLNRFTRAVSREVIERN